MTLIVLLPYKNKHSRVDRNPLRSPDRKFIWLLNYSIIIIVVVVVVVIIVIVLLNYYY